MKNGGWSAVVLMTSGLSLALTSCGGGITQPPPTTYVLTVNSASPASGIAITVTPADNNSSGDGTTSFTRTYNSGTAVTLTAPTTSGGNNFSAWTGCTITSTVTCNVTLGANTTVTATYAAPPPPTTYVLTVNSTTPNSGVAITVTPADNNSSANGTTSFTRTYNSGTAVTLTAPTTSGGNNFSAWTGCTTTSTVICNVTMSANTTVTATYAVPAVTVAPNPATATIGAQVQFSAKINGTASTAVIWTVTAPTGSSLSPGTISSSGLYTTPYPAPATVTVIATSTANTTQSGSVAVTLSQPAVATGPALTVNVTSQTGAINPDIYGMDAYLLGATAADTAAVAKTNITVDRWGGDSTERYNYQSDVTNSIDDWYFENGGGNGGDGWPAVSGVKALDALVESNNSNGIKTLGTVPVIGWVAKDGTSCSFPQSTYPNQLAVNGKAAFSPDGRSCGSGIYPNGVSGCTNSNGCNIPSDPTVTSIAAPPPAPPAASAVNASWANSTWTGGWVNYLVNKFGAGNSGKGVAIYDLDNEPTWWYSNDADVHPLPFTYDEVTNGGIGSALAIKTVDPTAQVSGPIVDFWWAYFYSMKDVTSGWSSGGPCYRPWSNPVDRNAHGGVPFVEYYLQQFAAAQTTYGVRLLDYLDLHTYFAAQYPANSGSGLGLSPAGDTGAQQARLNSTRAFWDPTYTDSSTSNGNGFPQPNYPTDSNYAGATNCNPQQQAPQLIRMMKSWVAKDYPGTKTAIDEYNFGGMEAINGALAQADILGIFGREGLDLGTMWPTADPSTQIPGMMAFQIYRNYDGNKSTFGNMALASTSANQGALSIYGALRSSDNAVTVVVINKTYGDLTDTLSLTGLATTTNSAKAYLYSNANLASIVAQPAVTITPPATGTTSTITTTFPAQSITLLVIPQ
ncbi:MAG: glycoside hydrolase family 44 protein [Terracidiphilus sp.]